MENLEGAVNIPHGKLRARLDELPRDKTIHVFCRPGQRSYYATRMLLQNGFDVKNISGGTRFREVIASSNPNRPAVPDRTVSPIRLMAPGILAQSG